MKILFDQGTPVPLRRFLPGHTVNTAYERGWSELSNGNLLTRAEQDGYEPLITTDRNLRYEQNLANRKIAIIVLMTTSWPRIQQQTDRVQTIVDAIQPGTYQEIFIE
ncbi:hypothetical protein [Vacuolonema iberomarrocanum]|uniref:hypothetical protein n=1 Tax=Vacuolonema iberomarrocanum TaxID=3454632 RepID=UPI0019DF4707|nr:hypothetical protein [filamentous cyanobacterium LEGE 07170]